MTFLQHDRTIESLSAADLLLLERDPVEFHRRRLGPPDQASQRQDFPTAVQAAFVAQVKDAVARRTGKSLPPLAEVLESSVTIEPASEWERAVKLGHRLVKDYADSWALDRLCLEGIRVMDLAGVRVLPGAGQARNPPKIHGEPDALLRPFLTPTVFAWKVAAADRRLSPGYERVFRSGRRRPEGQHRRYGQPLEALDPEWATELAIQAWLFRERIRSAAPVALDLVVAEEDGCVVARYRTTVTVKFQRALQERIKAAWQRIQTGEVAPSPAPPDLRLLQGGRQA